jgi:putative ABC transport system substrate-binding protein
LKRRAFISLIGGTAAWPLAARAQQAAKRMRRLGALIGFAENDQATQRSVTAFLKGLADLGWVPDRDLTINFRYGAGDADRIEPSRRNWVASSPM